MLVAVPFNLHGLTRVLIANMIEGVTKGFQKELKLVGVGYSADATKGNFLTLNVGYSHQIYFEKHIFHIFFVCIVCLKCINYIF